MALVTTPDGRTVYIPDFAAPVPPPPAPSPPPDPYWDPNANAVAFASGRPDMPSQAESTNPVTGGGAFSDTSGYEDKQAEYDSAGNRANPMRLSMGANVGPAPGVARIAQATGPVGTIGQIGKATPLDVQARGMDPTQAAAGLSQDLAQAQQAQQAQARQQALAQMPNTPEGQIQRGNIEAQDAVAAQQANARQQGAVEGQEATNIGQVEQESLARANKMREEYAQQQAARQADIQRRQADIEKAVKTELDSKIDDNRRWNNLGTGQKVLAGIAVALSGLGDVLMRKSGPNAAIGMIQQAIKDDVDAQVREREAAGRRIGYAKSSLDSYRDLVNDETSAHKMKLSEEYDRTAQEIRVASSKYADEKAKLRGEAIALQLERDAATLRTGAGEAWFGRDLQREQLANQKRQTQISAGHLGVAQGQLGLARRSEQFDEYAKLRGLDLQAAQLEGQGKDAAAKAAAAEQKLELEQGVAAPPTATVDPATGAVTLSRDTGLLKQANGKTWILPTEGEAKEFRKKKAAADSLIDVLDEIRTIRSRAGGESSWANSDDYQRLQVLKNNLVILKKAGTQGMSSDEDMNKIISSLGAKDPTSFRAQAAGLDEGREQIVKQLNTEARALKYTGEDIKYADPLANKPVTTPEDAAFGRSMKASGPDVNELNQAPGATYAQKVEAAFEAPTKAGTEQNAVVQSLLAKATDPKASAAQRDAAIARLAEGAQRGEDEDARSKFRGALEMALVTRKAAGN